MSSCFDSIHTKFGFGLMRLPMHGDSVDTEQVKQMVDAFLAAGFTYFDTAHGYIDGKSELAARECLTSRYPRDTYQLTNKLSGSFFKTEADIRPLFRQQLDACGVEYFDFYLMHAQSSRNLEHFRSCRAYEIAAQLKAEGKVKHVGISFHDTADVLEEILTEFPQVEVVQLQFNYLDYDDPKVQAEACYDVCLRHRKEVIVMEPVKGGTLAILPEQAQAVLARLDNPGSAASYALRFAAGFPNIKMVLSGMSTLDQLQDNIRFMKEVKPLNFQERRAIEKVVSLLRVQEQIPCTACRYCTEVCPQGIPIPEVFSALNETRQSGTAPAAGLTAYTCVRCGRCENACPQKLPIRDLLSTAKKELA